MMGMREVILQTHKRLNPPATCDKNNNREPIDGIFATTGIRIISGGYAPFNAGCPSDHHYLWIDVPYTDALGYSIPPHICPSARRLQCKNPKLVQKYNTQLSRALSTENLDTDLAQISNTALHEGWSHHLEQEYNRINDRQYTIRKDIESKIRNLRTGAIPWSPKLQRFRNNIQIWSMLFK
jgi:hypothetical protein